MGMDMTIRNWAAGALALMAASTLTPLAQAQTPAAPAAGAQSAPLPPADYSKPANWVCWPGAMPNACDIDLTTTVVKADGTMTTEPFKADPKAPIDCFYVYPTVSTDPGALANLAVETAERSVVKQQFARFGASCRLYAPVYRQFTLTALAAMMSGHPLPMPGGVRPLTTYADVKDAWDYYLAHANHGRGVVLIGHSQGSGLLTQLIAKDIEGKPAQSRIVSAILMGTSLSVPAGADVGGDFKITPLCHSATQLGCVIAYASFRETSPPPANSRFGRPRTPAPGMVAACVNPANLSGGDGPLHSYLAAGSESIAPGGQAPRPWVDGKTVTTPFVSTPGLLTARCVSTPGFNFLSIHTNADAASPRTSEIRGDVIVGGQILKDWGLHLIDANLAMGDLVDIVRQEGAAWVTSHG
jgi:pimeloyl-ACP methyl ester carboxylesterase